MLKGKPAREKGKIQLSEYFKELKEGDKVALKKAMFNRETFPSRMQGNTGVVIGKRGRAYIVQVADQGRMKKHIVQGINLKKLKN